MKIVAILEVMWGLPSDAARWFKINPNNHSGRRLIDLVGHRDFVVTNACPECVGSPSERGAPDPVWLRENLTRLCPDLVLVCGRVAGRTFQEDMVPQTCRVVYMHHPAARVTREWMNTARSVIMNLQDADHIPLTRIVRLP